MPMGTLQQVQKDRLRGIDEFQIFHRIPYDDLIKRMVLFAARFGISSQRPAANRKVAYTGGVGAFPCGVDSPKSSEMRTGNGFWSGMSKLLEITIGR